jgi:hypothetical protein
MTDAHALAIGISQYRSIRPLPRTYDAEDLAEALASPRHGAYPPASVATLLEGAATRAGILSALDALAAKTTASSTVTFYFSGHGGRLADGDGAGVYLMPVDSGWATTPQLLESAISAHELALRLAAIPAARMTIILDCCRAAGLAEAKDVKPPVLTSELSSGSLAVLSRGRGRAVLAASSIEGSAYVWSGKRNGVFTHHLLDGLRGAAVGAGGVIRICDLFHYVQQKVVAEMPGQRPIFKAELEENYPVALYEGGRAPTLVLPTPSDDFRYDAFISYRRKQEDRDWVEGRLVPRLEALGLRICIESRDFALGGARIREMQNAIIKSRYTVAVLSPSYLEGAFQDFQMLLAQHQSVETRSPRFIPIMRRECRPDLTTRTTEWLDMEDERAFDADTQRLALRLREAPRPPLSS